MFNQPLNYFQNNRNATALSGMPQMMVHTFDDWEIPLSFIKITQNVVEGDVVTTETEYNFKGVWQPMRDEDLQFKDYGQRSFSWFWLHFKRGAIELQTGDKIKYNGVLYKVMALKDYSLNNYIECELIQDYQN